MPRTLGQAVGFLLGFWLALCLSPLRVDARAGTGDAAYGQLESALQRRVDETRSSHHLLPLRRVQELDRIARAHSEDMVRRGYLSHHNPEGHSPLDRIQASGLEGFTLAAENVGSTNRSDPTREIVEGWLASPVHRRNLLMPAFNATGVGVARRPDGTFVYTQLYVTYPR